MLNSKKMYAGRNKGFTLVELIVVIVILAILATIAFLSFSNQSSSARDSTRLSDISNITKGLAVFNSTSGVFPMPDSNVAISASGIIIGYEGYIGNTVQKIIKLSANGGKDPLDGVFYTYNTDAKYKKFQITGFLENTNSISYELNPFQIAMAEPTSYSGRTIYTKGDSIGVILDLTTQLPIHTTGTGVDVVNTTGTYIVYFDNQDTASGDGSSLAFIADGGAKSCNEILISDITKKGKDGTYYINPTGTKSLNAFCDMSKDDGGWTFVVGIDGNNQNHKNADEVSPENLNSTGGKGKYSDAAINLIGNEFRMECSIYANYIKGLPFAATQDSYGNTAYVKSEYADNWTSAKVDVGYPIPKTSGSNVEQMWIDTDFFFSDLGKRIIYSSNFNIWSSNGCAGGASGWNQNGKLWVR